MGGSEEAAALLHETFDLPGLFALKDMMETLADHAAANANENLLQTLFSSRGAELMEKRK